VETLKQRNAILEGENEKLRRAREDLEDDYERLQTKHHNMKKELSAKRGGKMGRSTEPKDEGAKLNPQTQQPKRTDDQLQIVPNPSTISTHTIMTTTGVTTSATGAALGYITDPEHHIAPHMDKSNEVKLPFDLESENAGSSRSKRHQSVVQQPNKLHHGGNTRDGHMTTGLEQPSEEEFATDEDIDDDYEEMTVRGRKSKKCPGVVPDDHQVTNLRKGSKAKLHKTGDSKQGTGRAACSSESLKKRQHDSDDEDDDDFELRTKRRKTASRGTAAVTRASVQQNGKDGAAKTGRNTNNSRSSFLDNNSSSNRALGTAKVTKQRSTNNSLAQLIDDHLTATIGSLPQPASSHVSGAVANTPQPLSRPAATPAGRDRPVGWSNQEMAALIALVRAHREQPVRPDGQKGVVLHDAKLFDLMSTQMRQQYNFNRTGGACKNAWNRFGRRQSGIDNRKIPRPTQMATSLQ
jgi:hypothetical protein